MGKISFEKYFFIKKHLNFGEHLKLIIYRTDWTAIRRGAARATREIISQSEN